MQAVGQFDEHDADVAHHGQQHFAEVLRLCLGLALKSDLGQLGDAIHQLGHCFTKLLGQLLLGDWRVFDYIMEDGSDNGFVIEAHLGHVQGNCDGVSNIGLAGFALLVFVRLGPKKKSPIGHIDLVGLKILF